jgi:hypothetical protein
MSVAENCSPAPLFSCSPVLLFQKIQERLQANPFYPIYGTILATIRHNAKAILKQSLFSLAVKALDFSNFAPDFALSFNPTPPFLPTRTFFVRMSSLKRFQCFTIGYKLFLSKLHEIIAML